MKDTQLIKYLPIYYDRDRITWTKFGLKKTPTTFILDEKGIIVDKWIGVMNWNDITVEDLKSFGD